MIHLQPLIPLGGYQTTHIQFDTLDMPHCSTQPLISPTSLIKYKLCLPRLHGQIALGYKDRPCKGRGSLRLWPSTLLLTMSQE